MSKNIIYSITKYWWRISVSIILLFLILEKINFIPLLHRLYISITKIAGYQIDPFNLIATFALSLLTIRLAWQANKISEQAKDLSKKSLEFSRPKIIIPENIESGNIFFIKEELRQIIVKNVGEVDAIKIQAYVFDNNNWYKVKDYSLLPIDNDTILQTKVKGKYTSLLIFYQSIITKTIYYSSYDINFESESKLSFASSIASSVTISEAQLFAHAVAQQDFQQLKRILPQFEVV